MLKRKTWNYEFLWINTSTSFSNLWFSSFFMFLYLSWSIHCINIGSIMFLAFSIFISISIIIMLISIINVFSTSSSSSSSVSGSQTIWARSVGIWMRWNSLSEHISHLARVVGLCGLFSWIGYVWGAVYMTAKCCCPIKQHVITLEVASNWFIISVFHYLATAAHFSSHKRTHTQLFSFSQFFLIYGPPIDLDGKFFILIFFHFVNKSL